MRAEMTKDLQKQVAKYGSVLGAFRSQGGGGKGLMAGGITLLVFGLLFGVPLMFVRFLGGFIVFAIFGVPALAMILPGMAMARKRQATYLEYFQKETGYSLEELQEADQELMSPDAVKINSKTDRSGGKQETVFIITQHYFLSAWPVRGCYLRKLDDIVAAFYSDQIPGINGYRQNLFVISMQDVRSEAYKNEYTKKQYRGFENAILTDIKNCSEICTEAVEEMVARAPHIITAQNIAVNGARYNLLSMDNWKEDWAKILES